MNRAPVGRGAWAAAVAQGAAYVGLAGTVTVVLPLAVALLAPDSKEQHLAWLAAVSSVATAVSLPVVGALTDRTRSAWGPRAPWIVGGGLAGGLTVAAVPHASSLAALAVAWLVAQVALNVVDGGASAVVADDVAAPRRGTAAAMLAAATGAGSAVGVVVAGRAVSDLGSLGLVLGLAAGLGALAFCPLRGRAVASTAPRRRPGTLLEGARRMLHHRALRRVFASRVLLMLGMHGLISYQVYILADHVGMSLTRAAALAGTLAAVYLAAATAGGVVAGRWSDATGRRRPFVVGAALLLALGALAPVVHPTTAGIVALVVLGGLGSGAFLTTQLALMIGLLPSPEDAGRDLGFLGVATTAAQAAAPPVALAALTLGSGYGAVFALAVVCALGAAALNLPSRAANVDDTPTSP